MPLQQPQVPRLPNQDSATNRFQDAVREAVRVLWGLVFIPVYTTALRPVASDKWAGRFIRVRDNNQPEQLQFCLRNANGDFAWSVVSISPA